MSSEIRDLTDKQSTRRIVAAGLTSRQTSSIRNYTLPQIVADKELRFGSICRIVLRLIRKQRLEADLGPGLKLIKFAQQLLRWREPCLYHRLFTWGNLCRVEVKNVNYA